MSEINNLASVCIYSQLLTVIQMTLRAVTEHPKYVKYRWIQTVCNIWEQQFSVPRTAGRWSTTDMQLGYD